MNPLRISLAIIVLSFLTTPFCFAQSRAVVNLRVQCYYSSDHYLSLREITYSFQAGQFIADSLLTYDTKNYGTLEQKRAAERKQKKDGTYRKPVKGVNIVFSKQRFPVDTVKHIRETLPASMVNTAIENLDHKRSVRLSSLNITTDDINLHVSNWRKRPTTRSTWFVDSVARILTPEYEISKMSLDSCQTLCLTQSHGGSRYGIRIVAEYENGERKQITESDKCNVLPMPHLINLSPILESIPAEMFQRKDYYSKKMLLDFSVAAILAKLEGRRCIVRSDNGRYPSTTGVAH
jgi:hypothetical protein